MEHGTLKDGEAHPMAQDALAYVQKWMADGGLVEVNMMRESLASTALSGNRLAEICGATLERLLACEPVSDRYLLGLAWFIRNAQEQKK